MYIRFGLISLKGKKLIDINIVLVEPKGEENIGAVSRSMMNFGFERLILVNPQFNHLSDKSINYAIHSAQILKDAKILNNISEIKSNDSINIAITRRCGDWRTRDLYSYELANFLLAHKNNKVNLLFGREANGLTNSEIQLCDLICSIPTSQNFSSINLSHSVNLILYELFVAFGRATIPPDNIKENLTNLQTFNDMVNEIESFLTEADFFKNRASWVIKRFIKRVLLRVNLTDKEMLTLKNIFFSIKGIVKKSKP